jgi:hypothetical protein
LRFAVEAILNHHCFNAGTGGGKDLVVKRSFPLSNQALAVAGAGAAQGGTRIAPPSAICFMN